MATPENDQLRADVGEPIDYPGEFVNRDGSYLEQGWQVSDGVARYPRLKPIICVIFIIALVLFVASMILPFIVG